VIVKMILADAVIGDEGALRFFAVIQVKPGVGDVIWHLSAPLRRPLRSACRIGTAARHHFDPAGRAVAPAAPEIDLDP